MKNVIALLLAAALLGVLYVMNFGLYPQYFNIEWEEEVQLHDGRMIVVKIKRMYERRGARLEKYPEHPRQVSMSFTFDQGNGSTYSHTFQRGTLHFLDQVNGNWYIGYHADAGDPSVDIGNRNIFPHVAILSSDGKVEKPRSWSEVPSEITKSNILPATPNPKVISKFEGKFLSNEEKMAHWARYPTGAGWGTIQRIEPKTNTQGNNK